MSLGRDAVVNLRTCYSRIPALWTAKAAEVSSIAMFQLRKRALGQASELAPYMKTIPPNPVTAITFTDEQMKLMQEQSEGMEK